ncbi:leukotriene A-4 hydrolase/aminopeptidase [Aphanomyces invadans]|uniref:Leukotriene A-4 hydrolase/aminopeptidase n=1 Tax=Aphanomyces invadans TaxID=157072 RepID=A0A024UJZ5_9STRA|nr:leukotriene A-4 hydrolase/aminopeptidase [Aphanomyces invadans]ETW06771.1 leukotriene A-4 hydrolase/aminopeptidase [Aphanomyces invadans]|eukprot:XP_008864846.1 leukotriene A-4 hydrolase/aminopeptidase [Aphanomyces invadans]
MPTSTIVLDSKALLVHRATVDGADVAFYHVEDAVFGTALHVALPENLALGASFTTRIYYETTPDSSAVQWLPKEQTADKTHPYLFTQCQAIHARSLVPCQDCPLASSTYSAAITVPSWATCLMSAVATADPLSNDTAATKTFTYHQAIAIPSYLIAIVIGALESREIGPRSRVWCEPSLVDAAAFEFAQTESFIQHAEAIMNQEYVWGRYDLVCLPPSFPLGGMENPCLTFATPTLLAGDQSLADVIAHEIAHSWTGNLITNHTWEDFWLNEGWTMWLQRKIMARIHSPLHFDFDASIGWNDLQDSIDMYGADHEFTKLVPTLDGCDPDDAFSSVPYEKGFNFLYFLSKLVGDSEFEKFAQAYVQHFKYKTVTSADFKAFFIQHFTPTKSAELATVDWELWYYAPGMPLRPAFDTTISAASAMLADKWLHATKEGIAAGQHSASDVAGWTSSQLVAMLDTLLEACAARQQYLDVAVLHTLGDVYGLLSTQNAEIRMRFHTLCVRSEAAFILPHVEAFLKEQGRMKYVRPLFRDLNKSKCGHAAARRIFAEWKGFYHPICRSMVEKDLA